MNRISRRGLLQTGAAASLLAAAGLSAQAAPRRAGTLRLAVPGARAGLGGAGVFGQVLGQGTVFDCLTEVDAEGRLTGELAQGWEASGDARDWSFALRPGTRFHDGRPVRADDAVASLRAAGRAIPGLVSVRRRGRDGLRIRLSEGNSALPLLLADPRLVIRPADAAGVNAACGTGLYRLEGFDPGRTAWLARVEAHYKDGRAGWFEAVEVRGIDDPAERLNALLSGRVDAIDAIDPLQERQLARHPEIGVTAAAGNRHLQVSVSGRAARETAAALKLLIDREALLAGVLGGRGAVGADHPLRGVGRPVDRDPARAAALLDAAGVQRVTAGIDARLAAEPWAPRLLRGLAAEARAAGLTLAFGAAPEKLCPHIELHLAAACATDDIALSRFPRAGLADPEGYGRALEAARRESGTARRRAMHAELAAQVAAEGTTLVPFFADHLFAHSARLGRPERVGTLATLDSARIAERWYFG